MIIFIDGRPLEIITNITKARITAETDYHTIVDANLDRLRPSHFEGHLLVANVTPSLLEQILKILHETELPNLQSVTALVTDKEVVKERIKKFYKIVKAAGGVVFKAERILLMHRIGYWDLPKGKLDDGETSRIAAIREIEEETGVKATLIDKICTTYHTYTQSDRLVLKRTKWYRMECSDDTSMKPQTEEGITELRWMLPPEVKQAMSQTYSSIRWVLGQV